MNNIINKNSLIGFLMAGDPDLETTKKCIISMAQTGAGMVELGIPFSDPIAESSVIQSANIRALKSNTYLNSIFSNKFLINSRICSSHFRIEPNFWQLDLIKLIPSFAAS